MEEDKAEGEEYWRLKRRTTVSSNQKEKTKLKV